jgi:Flp pilus assembly protein TadD
LDTVRFRADSDVRQLQGDVAKEFGGRGVALVDADRWLHEWNPGFETDRMFFLEHVHLTFEGRVAVAALIVDGLANTLLGIALPTTEEAATWWKKFPDALAAARERTLFTGADEASMWNTVQRLLAMKVFAGAPDLKQRREELAELEHGKRQEFLANWEMSDVREAYEKATALNGEDPALDGTAGRLLQMGGDRQAAEEAFRRTLQKMPNRTESALGLVTLMIADRRFAEAEEVLRKQEAFDARVPDVAGLRATMLLMQQKPQEAVSYLERHLQQRPFDASARRNLASALLERGDSDAATAQFRRVVEVQPDDAYVLNNLAWLIADSPKSGATDLADAVKFSRRAVDLEPKVHRYRGTLAYALLRHGEREEALRTANEALQAATAAGDAEAAEMLRQKVLQEDRS